MQADKTLVERLLTRTWLCLEDVDQIREYLEDDSVLHHEVVAALSASAAREAEYRSQLVEAVADAEKLRAEVAMWQSVKHSSPRLEAAEARIAALVAGLKPFADAGRLVDEYRPDASDAVPFDVMIDEDNSSVISLTWGDLREARRLLEDAKDA